MLVSKSFNRKSVGFSGLSREKETVVQQVVSRSTAVHAVMTTSGTSFAVPAVPNSASLVDTTVDLADSTAVVYKDITLKKTGVKRACSDPGYQFSHRWVGDAGRPLLVSAVSRRQIRKTIRETVTRAYRARSDREEHWQTDRQKDRSTGEREKETVWKRERDREMKIKSHKLCGLSEFVFGCSLKLNTTAFVHVQIGNVGVAADCRFKYGVSGFLSSLRFGSFRLNYLNHRCIHPFMHNWQGLVWHSNKNFYVFNRKLLFSKPLCLIKRLPYTIIIYTLNIYSKWFGGT